MYSFSFAQEQPFKSGFRFILKYPDTLFLIQEKSKKVIKQTGYLEKSLEKILAEVDSGYQELTQKKNIDTSKSLVGIIKERNKDSLFIHFWYIKKPKPGAVKVNPEFVNFDDNDSLFVLHISTWRTSARGNYIRDIPYRNTQITGVNFPIRANLADGSIETGFTNAAITVTRIRGKARIYKSDFLEPRFRYWGYGLMFGVGSRKDRNDKEEFSINYGISLTSSIYGVKLMLAGGYENGFKNTSKKASPFIGVGFGLDIYSLVNPEIKNKE